MSSGAYVTLSLATLLLAVLGFLASSAQAAFPGANGRIVWSGVGADADGSDAEIYAARPGGPAVKLTENGVNDSNPSVSADGRKIAFDRLSDAHEIWQMDFRGRDQRFITAGSDPSWAPDGSRLAYVFDDSVHVVNADGTGAVTVAAKYTDASCVNKYDSPAFSPDGQKIAMTAEASCFDDEGNYEATAEIIWVSPDGAAGGLVNPSGVGPVQTRPTWSPDGRWLAYEYGGADIWITSLNGADNRKWPASSDRTDVAPAFSPDGSSLVFWTDRDGYGTGGLWHGSVAGTTVSKLVGATPVAAMPDWGPATAPPETSISAGPSGAIADTTPTWAFASSEPEATFECRIDSGSFTACASPYTTTPLADGEHTFAVRAVTDWGGADPTPATQAFKVVTGSPAGPAGTRDTLAPQFVLALPRRLTVRRNQIVRFSLACPTAETVCRGAVTILSARRKIGRATFEILGGRTKTVSVRLTRAAQRTIRRRGKLRATFKVMMRDAAGNVSTRAKTVTLVAARTRRG